MINTFLSKSVIFIYISFTYLFTPIEKAPTSVLHTSSKSFAFIKFNRNIVNMLTHHGDKYNKEFRKYLLLTKQNTSLRKIISSSLNRIPFEESEREKWLNDIILSAQTVFKIGEECYPPDDIFPLDEDW